MLCSNTLTLWHYSGIDKNTRQEKVPERIFLPAVFLSLSVGTRMGARGHEERDELTVRIPGKNGVAVSPGDRVLPGEHPDFLPPENAFLVTAVQDNRKGSPNIQHIKVVAG